MENPKSKAIHSKVGKNQLTGYQLKKDAEDSAFHKEYKLAKRRRDRASAKIWGPYRLKQSPNDAHERKYGTRPYKD